MVAFVVSGGGDFCPVGCGVEVILVRCLPGGRLAGWCWACEVLLPVPLPADYCLSDDDMDPDRYAPGGLDLPEWGAVAAADLSDPISEQVSASVWSERLAWVEKARRLRRSQ